MAFSEIITFLTILFVFFFLLTYISINRFSLLIFFIIVSKQIASCTLPVTRDVYNCRFLLCLMNLRFKKIIQSLTEGKHK